MSTILCGVCGDDVAPADFQDHYAEHQTKPTLPKDLFQIVVGHPGIKDLFWRSLEAPKPVHLLLVGDPSSAKSLFLLEASRLEGAVYTVGTSSTRAGITRLLADLQPKYLLIDELDKMATRDYPALLSVMESSIVTETKAGRTHTSGSLTKVYATANRIHMRMSEELLRRFLRLKVRPYGTQEFLHVVRKVLVDREQVPPKYARFIAEEVAKLTRDVRMAVQVARLAKDKRDAREVLEILRAHFG